MRPIKLTTTKVEEIVQAIRQDLLNNKFSKEQITVNFSLKKTNEETPNATVIFTELATKKMDALVQKCTEEVGWHGTVTKVGSQYTIEDILVFPQYVTGATVTPDETEYALWMGSLDNETFNKVRFHGHSHVNMGVTPSGVDTTFQANILNNLNSFYIFGIFNKKDANWMTIFDVEANIIYDDNDINLVYMGQQVQDWATEVIKENVKKKVYAAAVTTGTAQFGVNAYNNGQYNGYYDRAGAAASQRVGSGTGKGKKSVTESVMEDTETANISVEAQTIMDDYFQQMYGGN